jgi:7,8-dihydropterin-6-yl-methyl-4-(beta-D-ribofuranosyl)aminobenzene 5'-phosphate synthase
MIIKVLAENTSVSENLGCEHGLSLYIETDKHRLLFDTGASGLFAENAQKLGVDLSSVDLAVLSHGHYDHGGGLKTFLSMNKIAKVYINQHAFEKQYANRPGGTKEYIGLDETLLPDARIVFCGELCEIDEELELFSGIKGNRLSPSGNKDLLRKIGDDFVLDDFTHEQNLIIRKGGKTLLISGCAHNGIVNIIEHFKAETGRLPDYVIGGFHLYNPNNKENEKPETVDEIGNFLLDTKAQYYTCHCTGIESYNRLKTLMGENIKYLSTGNQITINM